MGFSLRLQRFCCCCSLRTGSLIIGTAGWIFTFIELFCVIQPTYNKSERYSFEDDVVDKKFKNLEDILEKSQNSNFYYNLGYGLVSLVICILLVIGVYKKDKRFILPWLVLKAFEGILLIIGTFIIFVIACTGGEYFVFLLIMTIILIIATVITWYTWLCVWSHYKEIGEGIVVGNAMLPIYYPPPNTAPPMYEEPEKSKLDFA